MSPERLAEIKAAYPDAWAEMEDILFGSYDAQFDALRAERDAALAALEALGRACHRHRTATHRVAPTFCKTCRESDAAMAAAGRVLETGEGER